MTTKTTKMMMMESRCCAQRRRRLNEWSGQDAAILRQNFMKQRQISWQQKLWCLEF